MVFTKKTRCLYIEERLLKVSLSILHTWHKCSDGVIYTV